MTHRIGQVRMRRIRELALDVERLRNTATGLAAEIDRLEGVIQFLTRNRRYGITRDALTVLRLANGPMTLRDIAVGVLARQGEDAEDGPAVNRLIEELRTILGRHAAAGIVQRERAPGPAWVMLWSVAKATISA